MLGSHTPAAGNRGAKRRIGRLSRLLRKYLKIDEQRTPNILEIIGKLQAAIPGFKIKLVSDERFPKIEAWTNSDTRTIYITRRVMEGLLYGKPRARFTVAHEIGHLVLLHGGKHHRKPRKRYEKDHNGRPRLISRKQEREANKFASTLLMPAHLISRSNTAEDIARDFHVSLQAARIRVEELKACHGQEDFGWEEDSFVWDIKPTSSPTVQSPEHAHEQSLSRDFAFVAMSLDTKFQPLYRGVIRPAIEASGLDARRGDDFHQSGVVFHQIQSAIRRCKVVIADLTGCNGNVLMEIGMALSIDKHTILICHAGTSELDIPYNMRHLRRLPYTEDAPGGVQLHQELVDMLREAIGTMPAPERIA